MPATTEDHSIQTTNHRPFADVYDDEADRLAATGFPRGEGAAIVPFAAADLYKCALQIDNYSVWALAAITPVWVPLGLTRTVRTIAADDAAEASDDIVFLNTAGGVVTLAMMAVADRKRQFTVKNIGTAGNSGFVNPDGADTIDGDAANYELVDGDSITFIPRAAGAWETYK